METGFAAFDIEETGDGTDGEMGDGRDRLTEALNKIKAEQPHLLPKYQAQRAMAQLMAEFYLNDPSLEDVCTYVESGLPLTDGQWDRLQPVLDRPEGMFCLGKMMLVHGAVGSRYAGLGYGFLAVGLERYVDRSNADPKEILESALRKLVGVTNDLAQTVGKRNLHRDLLDLRSKYLYKLQQVEDLESRFPVAPSVPRPPGL